MKQSFQRSVVLAVLALFGQPVAAETLSGLVSEPVGGTALPGIAVEVHHADRLPMELSTVVTTGVDGVYQAMVTPGTYSLRFVDPTHARATTCFGGSADLDSAARVTITPGGNASGIDMSLGDAGGVSGVVDASAGGTPLPGIRASLYVESGDAWSWVASGVTDGSGHYVIEGVPEGSYRMEFLDESAAYFSQVYNGATSLASGNSISMGGGSVVSNINGSLNKGSVIEGTITVPGGGPPPTPVRVEVWHSNGFAYNFQESVKSDVDGTYAVRQLESGVYKLLCLDPTGEFGPEYFGESETLQGASPVLLGTGATESGCDISLDPASAIEGTVTESGSASVLSGVRVTAYQQDGGLWKGAFCGIADSNGAYRVQGLKGGNYRLAFEDDDLKRLSEVWVDAPVLDAGSDVSVPVDGTTMGRDTALEPGARIAGRVTASDGSTPLPGIWVTAYSWTNGAPDWQHAAVTDASGDYEIEGLPAGPCRVVFDDWSGEYLGEVYDNDQGLANGTTVVLAAGSLTPGVDASLGRASTISGVVTAPNGSSPLSGILVVLYAWDGVHWEAVQTVQTGAGGSYRLTGLASGTFRLGFSDPGGTYLETHHGGARSVAYGADLVVGSESDVLGLDISLSLPGTIGGTVTTVNIFEGLPGIPLFAERVGTGERTYGESGIFGWYSISDLLPGQYYLGTEVESGSVYVDEWYQNLHRGPNEPAPPQATAVQVSSGGTASGKHFRMDVGGEVAGQLTALGNVPLAYAEVTLAGSYGDYNTRADENGAYAITGVAPDAYTLKVSAPGLLDEWWNGAHTATQATVFAVGLNDVLTRDVDLDPGQGQALIAVTSDPPGAEVFLDFHAVGVVTPALIDVGEAYLSQTDLPGVAPHRVTVKLAGSPRPAPQPADALEGDTHALHFALQAAGSGAIEVITTPAGAEVYVDTASAPVGVSPITLTDLAPGTHTLLLRKDGYLLPRPVDVSVRVGNTVAIQVPLTPAPAALPASVVVQTVPPRAQLYMNYLLPGIDTDTTIEVLDPASHEGADWASTVHVVLLRKPGYRAAVPRMVDPAAGSTVTVGCVLLPDHAIMTDANADGMPDEWQDAYDLVLTAPAAAGPEHDPDGDGLSNRDEMRAGTDPLDPASNLMSQVSIVPTPEGLALRMTFPSVFGQRYLIQCIDLLTDPQGWQLVAGGLIGDGTPIALEAALTGDAGTRSYRALALAP